ncbi:MAG: hypothetical protein AAGK97_11990, partial [Bacteroidota bacterium]
NDPNNEFLPGWQLWQTLETPSTPVDQTDNTEAVRGFQVDINDNLMIISTEDEISPYPDTNSVEIYRLDPNSTSPNWILDTLLYEPSAPNFLGYRVAIDGRTCVMSRWQGPMEVISDNDSDGNWEVKHVDHFLSSGTYGIGLAISGDLIAVGDFTTAPNSIVNAGSVFIYKIVGDSVLLIQEINGTFANARIGRRIAMDDQFLIIGNGITDSSPSNDIYVYTWNPGTEEYNANPQVISLPNLTYGSFGDQIELKNGILAITTPSFTDYPVGFASASRVMLFKNDNGTFVPIQTSRSDFIDQGGDNDKYPENFGTGMGLSDHHIIIGSPYNTLFNGSPTSSIHFFDLYPHQLYNVNASDGTEAFTKVTWESNFDPQAVKEIRIYRDQYHIATVAGTDTVFIDKPANLILNAPAAITGEVYTYSVRQVAENPYDVETFEAVQSDKGYAPISGKYAGVVYVNGTTTPVEGVKVEISAVLNSNIYKYDTITDINGEFTFENLPFSNSGSAYHFELDFMNHPFELINPAVIPAL